MAENISTYTWDYFNKRVQEFDAGNFVNGAYFLLAAGPPTLTQLALTTQSSSLAEEMANAKDFEDFKNLVSGSLGISGKVIPIGITQNFGIGQNRQFMQIFEIGSERSIYISGRSTGGVNIGRILYNKDNLLKMLYKPVVEYDDATGKIPTQYTQQVGASAHIIRKLPGSGDFFFNLYSDLFVKPFGLMFIMKDTNGNIYAASYIEQCYIPGYNFGVDANGTIIQESASILFERLVPIPINFISSTTV